MLLDQMTGRRGGAGLAATWHRLMPRRGARALVLACLILLTLSGVASAFQGYAQYCAVRSEAAAGMAHLKRVEATLEREMKQPTLPDAATLKATDGELVAAEHDFALARRTASTGALGMVAAVPGTGRAIGSALALISAADEACLGGMALVHAVEVLAPVLRAGLVNGAADATGGAERSSSPVLTAASLHQATVLFETAIGHLDWAVGYAGRADLSALPASVISRQQAATLRGAIAHWPSVRSELEMADAWLRVAPALLGVRGPERFLVELMDRDELRPTGGFIGSYGVMTVQDGRIQPFVLSDIFSLDLPYVEHAGWPAPPAGYSWWPFSGFALRDSNLSADFPTSARQGIRLLRAEGGPDVQGVIALTAPVIEQVMSVVGPLPLPEYGVTVTAQNLEALIRYYTETSAAGRGTDLPPSDQLTTLHERFTAVLGRALLTRLHAVQGDQVIRLAQVLLSSLQTKDLQVYFSDAAAEQLLARTGLDASMAHGPGDAVTIVDANTEANKANFFTSVTYADAVTIDQRGTATHHLTITYRFDSAVDPSMIRYLYGLDYYETYLRVYAPANAKLIHMDGLNGGDEQINKSDQPGRQMWGGYVYVQDGVPYALHFTWSVPNAATRDAAGHTRYTLEFQHQAGSRQFLDLTVTPPGARAPVLTYDGTLDADHQLAIG